MYLNFLSHHDEIEIETVDSFSFSLTGIFFNIT